MNIGDPTWVHTNSCRIVAEAGQCMRGDIKRAMAMAEVAKNCGAWGFKVQLLKPELIASENAELYWENTLGNVDQRQAFTRAGLVNYDDWQYVKRYCDKIGINFIATPFDLEAVQALEKMGCEIYKIASGDITNRELIEAISATHRLIILSTGASTHEEILRALSWIKDDLRVLLLACTLSYPTPVEAAELNRIQTLQYDFFSYIGYSDHTSSPKTALACAAMGSVLNEVHFDPYDDDGTVADTAMAVDGPTLAQYVDYARIGSSMRGTGTLAPTAFEKPASIGARRSLYANRFIQEGTMFERGDFIALRPGGNVEPWQSEILYGQAAKQTYSKGEVISVIELLK